MADLKINQLDPIIPVSTGTGATYSALSDADLFIVKMKVRGTAIGDEDRKLTWLELRNSLNLGQYMGTVGGNFTGDITLSNNKAVKGQQTGAGADIALITVDTSNRVNVGNTTNLTRIASSSIPQYVDGSGTYNFITSKNLPVPGDINAYTKAETDAALALKANLAGANFTDVISLPNNKAFNIADSNGTMRNAMLVNASNNFWVGDKQTNLKFNSLVQPTVQVGANTTNYAIYHAGNKPTAADLNLYTKAQVDAADSLKLDKAGGTMTGSVFYPSTQGIGFQSGVTGQYYNGMTGTGANLQVGDTIEATTRLYSLTNPTVRVGSVATDYAIYHAGNKPTFSDLGIDTALNLKMDKAGGNFSGNVTLSSDGQTSLRFVTSSNRGYLQAGNIAAATDPTLQQMWLTGYNGVDLTEFNIKTSAGNYANIKVNGFPIYHGGNKPTFTDVGSYSIAQSDAAFARKGVNADITALNGLTGTLKVGANASLPLEVTTLQQVQALTSGTAGAVVGVVGGFIGAVMWFNGTRATIPAGWVAADGTLLNRSDYPDLWTAANSGALVTVDDTTWLNAAGSAYVHRAKYSTGNGSSTFRVPDLNGQQSGSLIPFLRGDGGGTSVGVVYDSGAPNITGSLLTNLPGNANINTVVNGTQGALAPNGTATVLSYATGMAYVAGNSGVSIDASRVSPVYGRASEVRPQQAVGIWIIRASNNFVAANTNFAVYNGSSPLPATGTPTSAGLLQSIYNVNGVQDHSMTLYSQRTVGQPSRVVMSVSSQAQGSVAARSYDYTFGSDGTIGATNLTVSGIVTTRRLEARPIADPVSPANGTYINTPEIRSGWQSRGNDTNVAYGYASFYAQENVGQNFSAIIQLQGYSKNNAWYFSQDGTFTSPGNVTSNSTGFSFVANGARQSGSNYVNGFAVIYLNSTQRSEYDTYNTGSDIQSRIITYNGNAYNVLWVGAGGSTGDNRGTFTAGGSDIKLKDNVQDAKDGATDRIMAVKPREFDWKHDGRHDRGWIAQELEEIDETYVFEENGIKNVSSNAIIADLIATVQLLRAEVDALKAAKA